MVASISPLDPIQWYEGMLLTPQLFQQADVREGLLRKLLLSVTHPFFSGVTTFAYDLGKLASGLLQITDLRAIFPDGLIYEYLQDSPKELSLDLKPFKATIAKQPQIVSLVVPTYKPMAANVTGDFPRYVSEGEDMAVDSNTGDNTIYFPRIHPNTSLLLGDVPARYTSLPLLRITMNQETFLADESFTPPYVILTQKEKVPMLLADVLADMRGKINYLFQKQAAFAATYGAAAQGEKSQTTLLQTLASALLELEGTYYSNVISPYDLYLQLCSLAGRLSPLNPTSLPPFFGAYNHTDQYTSLTAPLSYIQKMIQLLQQDYRAIPFNQSGRYFTLPLDATWTDTATLYVGVKLSGVSSSEDALGWLNEVVITTEDMVQSVRERRILGAQRKLLDPDQLVEFALPPGVVLLQVQATPDFITPGKTLCLFNISDEELDRPQEVLLYISTNTPSAQSDSPSSKSPTSSPATPPSTPPSPTTPSASSPSSPPSPSDSSN